MENYEITNPQTQIYDKIEDKTNLSFNDGTIFMKYLLINDINIEADKAGSKVGFIWKPQLLSSDVLKKNNIKFIIQGLEQKMELKNHDFTLTTYIDLSKVIENPSKMSFLIVKAVVYIKRLEETDDEDSKAGIIEDFKNELQGFDELKFKEFTLPESIQQNKNEQYDFNGETQVSNQQIACDNTQQIIQANNDALGQSDQVRQNIYNTWDKKRLIEYILLLENTNTKLEQQAKQMEKQFQEYKISMKPIIAKQQHLLKVPDIIRNEFKQQKIFGLW